MAVITANKAKTIFRDETSGAHEMPYRSVSDASSCYLVFGRGGNPISIIFVGTGPSVSIKKSRRLYRKN